MLNNTVFCHVAMVLDDSFVRASFGISVGQWKL